MNFEKNVELDARLVLAAMGDGINGVINFAFRNRHHFPTPNDATDRCDWLKKQSHKYIAEVSERAAAIERGEPSTSQEPIKSL
jgi:hypothetical protein